MKSQVLIVGHYCHDTLIHSNGSHSAALGGSAAYMSSVFSSIRQSCSVVSKVGADFAYHHQISHPPMISNQSPTTQFIADFTRGERIARVAAICDPIYPSDLPESNEFEIGLAVGIVGEVLPDTFLRLAQKSKYFLCDIQGLIRTFDANGKVENRPLESTPYIELIDKISFLKASRIEAEFMDLQKLRHQTCILVTEGELGCTVYQGNREFRVPAFAATEVDPTGAGDCFLAGFTAGILRGFPLERAVRVGNYFGGLAVSQVGVPHLKDVQISHF